MKWFKKFNYSKYSEKLFIEFEKQLNLEKVKITDNHKNHFKKLLNEAYNYGKNENEQEFNKIKDENRKLKSENEKLLSKYNKLVEDYETLGKSFMY